jgi:DNA-binding response OmpR family regulator
MQLVDFSGKRVLVIDASGLVRSSAAKILSRLGFVNIKTSNASARALELVEQIDFDLVIVGDDNSDGKTGLHVLEEARFKGLIKSSAIWGFMSADQSTEKILHATQIEPDFLISKPFNAAQLSAKLLSSLARKQAVKPINKSIDEGNIKKALEFCDFALKKDFSTDSVKPLKADLLIQTQRYTEALALLEEIAKEAPHNNIELKMCEALIGAKKHNKALAKLDNLIENTPLLIKAYDLKSAIHQSNEQFPESLSALLEAVKLSSLAIPRNLKLGALALTTGELSVAQMIFKRTIQLNKGSCHNSAEPYLGLANTKREILKGTDDTLAIEKEISAILKSMLSAFPEDLELRVKVALFREQLQRDLNNGDNAALYLQQAMQLLEDYEIAGNIEDLKNSALSVLVATDSEKRVAENDSSVLSEDKKPQPQMSNKVNIQGIKQYLNHNHAKATKYFTMALELDNENCAPLLNLAQIYIESLHVDVENQAKSLRMAKRYLGLIENLTKSESENTRYKELLGHIAGELENIPKGSLGMLLK